MQEAFDNQIDNAAAAELLAKPTCANAGADTNVRTQPLPYRFIKRTFDIVFSSAVIVVGFIPALILSIFIAKDTKASPIYLQIRMGKDKKPFKIYKFRSMVYDSDNVEKYLNEEQLIEWMRERKVEDDPRITKLGSFIRKTSIDEIPQFINVLVGQMSVVGPRPITEDELIHFKYDADKLLSMRPGITGWWQTQSRNDSSFDTGERQALELYYIDNASVRLDMRIAVSTLKTMRDGTGS
ncbi:sugar transferase [Adlercreutzia sp. ZJ154]|uniref:sugar transferase n=1 Tax=Adlercreutzia sp. ZJ154 TaxID=2709790 RepID=UPI001F151EE1|nr:sugar transferase [Adlercreutzia sp. ZJ154]